RFRERVHRVDDRLDGAALHRGQQRLEILARPAVGADDVDLATPDVADVGPGIEAGGGPAGEQPPVPGQRAQARYPRVAARVVDEDVDALLARDLPGAPGRSEER